MRLAARASRWVPALLLLLLMLSVPGGRLPPRGSSPSAASGSPTRLGAALPAGSGVGDAPQGGTAGFDEQAGLSFTQDSTSLAYNVTAVEQTDQYGNGVGYLLNGLTDQGYWYQVGVSYNWPYKLGGHASGFMMSYEVFDSLGDSIYPASGGGGLVPFTGTVDANDDIAVTLKDAGGLVSMQVEDLETQATASQSYAALGSTFVGQTASPSDLNGFFTGLMTERYTTGPVTTNEAGTVYFDEGLPQASGWFWVDGFYVGSRTALFSDQSTSPVDLAGGVLQSFVSNGLTENATGQELVTGIWPTVTLSVGYSIVGGSSGAVPPVIRYVYKTVDYEKALAGPSVDVIADLASPWSVDQTLAGSSASQRWYAPDQTGGAALRSGPLSLTYYHQYLVDFSYSVVGPGGTHAPPQVAFSSLGQQATRSAPLSTFVDAGTQYHFEALLGGSGESERWYAANSSGVIASPGPLAQTYLHQYLIGILVTDASGNTTIDPASLKVSAGNATETAVNGSAWVVSGEGYSISHILWEGVDVAPQPPQTMVASGPATTRVKALVYETSLRVIGLLGLPDYGARVQATFVNGSRVDATVGADALVRVGLTPLGTLNGTVSSLGQTSRFTADGSGPSVPVVVVVLSPGLVAVLSAAGLAAVLVVALRRRKAGRDIPFPEN